MRRIFLFGLFIGFIFKAFPQKINIGLLSGTNFSDIHERNKDDQYYRWKTKKGPVSGFLLSYSLNRFISLNTEFNYSTIYYEKKSQIDYYYYWPIINPTTSKEFQLSIYRIPAYLKCNTPGKLKFEMSAGAYISFLENYESDFWSSELGSSKKDWGYFYSAGFSYSINNNINMFLNGRYITGRQNYELGGDCKLASYELIFGIGYSGLFQKIENQKVLKTKNDTLSDRLFFKYKVGFNSSWIRNEEHQKYFTKNNSLMAGVSLKYKFGKTFAWIADVLYERKGYNYNDSSSLNYRYFENDSPSKVNTQIDLDYIVIPILLNADFGKKYNLYISTGSYFGFVLDAKYYGETWETYITESSFSTHKEYVYKNIEDKIWENDWGWVFNTGFQFPIFDRYKLDLEIRYNLGIKNIFKESDISGLNDDYFKNRSLSVSLGLIIPL